MPRRGPLPTDTACPQPNVQLLPTQPTQPTLPSWSRMPPNSTARFLWVTMPKAVRELGAMPARQGGQPGLGGGHMCQVRPQAPPRLLPPPPLLLLPLPPPLLPLLLLLLHDLLSLRRICSPACPTHPPCFLMRSNVSVLRSRHHTSSCTTPLPSSSSSSPLRFLGAKLSAARQQQARQRRGRVGEKGM